MSNDTGNQSTAGMSQDSLPKDTRPFLRDMFAQIIQVVDEGHFQGKLIETALTVKAFAQANWHKLEAELKAESDKLLAEAHAEALKAKQLASEVISEPKKAILEVIK